jgi:hypothetical protein
MGLYSRSLRFSLSEAVSSREFIHDRIVSNLDPSHRRVDNPVASALQGEIASRSTCRLAAMSRADCPHANAGWRVVPQLLEPCADGRVVRCHRLVAREIGVPESIEA